MSEANNGLEVLKKKYRLHAAPEVEAAARRRKARTGEGVPQDPLLRIDSYLDRFREIVDREDPGKRQRGLEALKRVLHQKFVVKPEKIPEAYWENQRRLLRERGQGADLDRVDWREVEEQNTEAIIADQRSSLDNWIDYLASPDATYPDWLKYWALRSVLGLAKYDKEKKRFPKRTEGTTNPFPELNREALAYVVDAIEKKYKKQTPEERKREEEKIKLEEEELTPEEREQRRIEREEFEKFVSQENFGKLYAWAIEKVTPASIEALIDTRGKWVKYPQGSDHMPLVESLQGHGTGWCTAGESTAEMQLEGGDFYVYYSLDERGKPTIPRVAIRMEGARIAEVRGVAYEQNLDPFIGEVVEEKLREFGAEGQAYEKRVNDMKRLTEIERKMEAGAELDKDELVFLYEINGPIEGFGYHRDPRIEELRMQRNPEADMPVVFECRPEQIARSTDEINEDTRAYVGELVPGIFDKLPDQVEHIYTSFPERKIRRKRIEIGGKAAEELLDELSQAGIRVSSYAKDMLRSRDFTTLKSPEEIDLIRLTVADLGFTGYPTTNEVFERAEELGLELCPAEVGPHYRLQYMDQPMNEWLYIGMRQIAGSGGDSDVFELGRGGGGLWLGDGWAEPGGRWFLEGGFVFRLRQLANA